MKNRFFGEVVFNSGWETHVFIAFHGEYKRITVSAEAFYEKDAITEDQENSFVSFLRSKEEVMQKIEAKVNAIGGHNYVPTLLLIRRNGESALIFDDKTDPEGGIAIVIDTDYEVYDIDQYL